MKNKNKSFRNRCQWKIHRKWVVAIAGEREDVMARFQWRAVSCVNTHDYISVSWRPNRDGSKGIAQMESMGVSVWSRSAAQKIPRRSPNSFQLTPRRVWGELGERLQKLSKLCGRSSALRLGATAEVELGTDFFPQGCFNKKKAYSKPLVRHSCWRSNKVNLKSLWADEGWMIGSQDSAMLHSNAAHAAWHLLSKPLKNCKMGGWLRAPIARRPRSQVTQARKRWG